MNIFTIYAFANIHDVTWGTRPTSQNSSNNEVENHRNDIYRSYRFNFLVVWIIVNTIVGYSITFSLNNFEISTIFIAGFIPILFFIAIYNLATIHWIISKLNQRKANRIKMSRSSSIFKKKELKDPEGICKIKYCLEQQIEERKEVLPKIQRIRNPKDREENKIYETSVVIFHLKNTLVR